MVSNTLQNTRSKDFYTGFLCLHFYETVRQQMPISSLSERKSEDCLSVSKFLFFEYIHFPQKLKLKMQFS